MAPQRLVFMDETWNKTNMAPLRGWAPRGKRLPAKVPHGHRLAALGRLRPFEHEFVALGVAVLIPVAALTANFPSRLWSAESSPSQSCLRWSCSVRRYGRAAA